MIIVDNNKKFGMVISYRKIYLAHEIISNKVNRDLDGLHGVSVKKFITMHRSFA